MGENRGRESSSQYTVGHLQTYGISYYPMNDSTGAFTCIYVCVCICVCEKQERERERARGSS